MAVLLATCALAGHSSVSFAGGNVHVTDSEPPCAEDFPYQTAGNTRSDGGVTGVCGDPPGIAGAGTVDCSGTVTATFTWVPDYQNEPRPLYLVIQETATAHWDGDSGACANGLGHAPTGSQYDKTSQGERWTLKSAPGTSFQITVTPSASTEWSTGVCGNPAGTASVSWQVQIHHLDIVPGGLTWNSNTWQPMIGQQVVGTLVRPTLSGSTQSWSVTKGDKFADYQASQASAHVTDYNVNNTETGLSTSVFFRAPGLATIKCNVFVGGPIQQNVSLQRNITVEKPSSTIAVSIGAPRIGDFANGQGFGLYDAPALHTDYHDTLPAWWGVRWGADPNTPAPWDNEGSGGWHWTQRVLPSRHWTWGGQEHAWSINGAWGLDTRYPYEPPPYQSPGPGAYPANGYGETDGDAPQVPLEHPPYDAFRAGSESFRTYLMYEPPPKPGFGVRWVALKEISWYWAGRCEWSLIAWVGPTDPAAQWSYTGDFPRQPEWTMFHDADTPPPGPPSVRLGLEQ
ncbi:MAG: hypothetical protein AB7F50_09475 [Fimbriimonadaceae bacterium]